MSPSELDDYFHEHPLTAFRVVLSSGDQLMIPDARSIAIEGFMLRVTYYASPDRFTATRHRMISIPNIAMVEPTNLPSPPEPPRRGRRRK